MTWQTGFAPLTPQRREMQGPLPEVLKRWWRKNNDEWSVCDATEACNTPAVSYYCADGHSVYCCAYHSEDDDIQAGESWIDTIDVT